MIFFIFIVFLSFHVSCLQISLFLNEGLLTGCLFLLLSIRITRFGTEVLSYCCTTEYYLKSIEQGVG